MAASLFALKFGLAIGGAITGWVLGWYGFEANVAQSEESLTGIVMIMSFLPALFGIMCVVIMARYPLNNRRMGEIERDLRSEEHTSELQSRGHLVCRLLLEQRKQQNEVR